jgi:hypothetical protein
LSSATDVLGEVDAGEGVETDPQVGKVSIVGAGMRSHPGVAAKVFKTLGDNGINIEMISTSPIKISCVIAADRVPDAVRSLHDAFELGGRRPRGGPLGRTPPTGDVMTTGYRVGVVGATGAVGTTILEVLAEREFPADEVVPFSSERWAGTGLRFRDGEIECRPLSPESITGLDLVLSSAGGAISSEWAPRFVEAGAVVVDNTSFWRMHPDVPLVVSEVNPEAADGHSGLIANPNCTTMAMVVALAPIHRAVGIERLVVSTYQSVSGTGRQAIEELHEQNRALLGDGQPSVEVFPHQVAYNVIPQVETFKDGDDYTTEERKVMAETHGSLRVDQRADTRPTLAGGVPGAPLSGARAGRARLTRRGRLPACHRRRRPR